MMPDDAPTIPPETTLPVESPVISNAPPPMPEIAADADDAPLIDNVPVLAPNISGGAVN